MIASPAQQDHGYKEADVRRWLTWIASQMQRHGQSVFRIERIQPSWLVHRHEHVIYVMLTRVMAGLIIGVVAASLDMTLSLAVPESSGKGIAGAYWRPLGWGSIAGFSTGLAMLAKMEPRIRAKLGLKSELTGYLLFSMMNAIVAAIGMLIYASIFWWWTDVFLTKGDIVLIGLIAIMHGLLGIRSLGRNFNADIQSTETLGWSTQDAIPGCIAGTLVAFALVNFYVFYASQMDTNDPRAWIRVVIITLEGSIIGAVFHGFRAKAQEIESRPNQGIYLSAKHSIIAGICIGLMAGVAWGTCIGIQENNFKTGLLITLYGFITNYLVTAFWFGGHDVMRHCILRVLLTLFGYIPLRLISFLDFADSKLSLLRLSGGGYQFIHRYLQEYFAKLQKT